MDRVPFVRVRCGGVYRAGWLTPYLLETVASEVRHRADRSLQVDVAEGEDPGTVAWVRECFGFARSVRIRVVPARVRRGAAA